MPMEPPGRAIVKPALAGGMLRGEGIGRDLVAGLTLAAITIPEQMATARLGGFEPQLGFLAFVAATIGFALLGASRLLTVGADSTITPIFAGTLATLAAGGASLGTTAPLLALMVGALLVLGGLLRLGWVADLLSTPVVTGFLAGISVHIVVSQLPGLLGIPGGAHDVVGQLRALGQHIGAINPISTVIGLGVFAAMLVCERMSARLPGALIALALATIAVPVFGLEARGVAVLGALPAAIPQLPSFALDWSVIRQLLPLALVLCLIVMMQGAAVSRSFRDPDGADANIDRDFLGLGAANLVAGLAGSFPVNASPPRTAVVAETGGSTQRSALLAAAIVLALALAGGSLLAKVPQAALAGVLLFVAQRIFRLGTIMAVACQAPAEFGLILLTALGIVFLPIEAGVAIGIGISLLHGVWMTTRSQPIEFGKIEGTTIWWPPEAGQKVEPTPGVLVVGFQAPLLFANANSFRQAMLALIETRRPAILVLEASAIAAIDYTAAQALSGLVRACREQGIGFAIARLESVRARAALLQFGITAELGSDHLFHSVEEAVVALRQALPTGARRPDAPIVRA
ncbi:SulP family inorganic anion transporter [Bosea sp. BK604]|uniref:SulP family inorganic anion transporter n=1 Tax=Bosea sp. BK604 TaxID=2512180 RepID=UPI0010EAB72B|nr:SulP family inorganic anion transporter [Bosea sp. BK604]TCR64947.1 MFS superfamily sulfate permease-like transporter [Bosea sp. BK604]